MTVNTQYLLIGMAVFLLITILMYAEFLAGVVFVIFALCVYALEFLGDITGLDYIRVNVIIFCLLLPAYLIYSSTKIINQKRLIKKLNAELQGKESQEQTTKSV